MNWFYEGFRGETCLKKHEFWESLSEKEKLDFYKKMVEKKEGTILGWFDALNPQYNWSYSEKEVEEWFVEEGFSEIKRGDMSLNINMNGILQ